MNRKKVLAGMKIGALVLAATLLAAFIGEEMAEGDAGSRPETIAAPSGAADETAAENGQDWNMDGAYDSVFGKTADEWYEISMPVQAMDHVKAIAASAFNSDCVSTLPEAILKNKVTEFHFSFSEEGRTRSLAYSAVEDKTYEW